MLKPIVIKIPELGLFQFYQYIDNCMFFVSNYYDINIVKDIFKEFNPTYEMGNFGVFIYLTIDDFNMLVLRYS